MTGAPPPRWAIVGAGAMGSTFGGYLALAGHDVTLVDLRRDHVEAVASTGLHLEIDGAASLHTRPRAVLPDSPIEADVVIVLAKAYATEESAEIVAAGLTRDGVAITLQNGLDNAEMLAQRCGAERVAAGATTVGAEYLAPGRVKVARSTATGESVTTVGFERSGDDEHVLRAAAAALSAAGLPTSVSNEIGVPVWTKAAMAAAAGSLTALSSLRLDDLLADSDALLILEELVREIVAVAAAYGIALDADETWKEIRASLERGGPHLTSMATDLLRGRRTENDALLGAVARRAAEAGVEAPMSTALYRFLDLLVRTRDARVASS